MEWIAANSHGWITYPRRVDLQQRFVEGWQDAVHTACGPDVFKPFSQSLFIDLLDDPVAPPQPHPETCHTSMVAGVVAPYDRTINSTVKESTHV